MFFIETEKCIECGLCMKACEVNGSKIIKVVDSPELRDNFLENKQEIMIDTFYTFLNFGNDFLLRTGKGSCSRCQECFFICPKGCIRNIFDSVIGWEDKKQILKRTKSALYRNVRDTSRLNEIILLFEEYSNK
jgi:ferredoxin